MEFCHSFGKDASLVVIETQLENTYLKKWLLKHGTNFLFHKIKYLTI